MEKLTDGSEHDEIFAALLATAFDPEIVRCANAVQALADYDIPVVHRTAFIDFHHFITTPQPNYISAWRADPKAEQKWYRTHVNGILGDVRGALAAAHYHRGNLATIEDAVTQTINESDFATRMGNSTMGLGGTRKMDFEYQAFVLACRRALEYLAGALSSYFKTEAYNFRRLPKSISKKQPILVADAIAKAHARHVDKLAFVLADGRESTRNRIAHYEFVAAGVINLSRQGFVLVGGGENLSWHSSGDVRLQDALSTRLSQIHACVDDMIESFISAARIASSQD